MSELKPRSRPLMIVLAVALLLIALVLVFYGNMENPVDITD